MFAFTLDPTYGEFVLTHENIQIPKTGKIYSFNEGNYDLWDDKLKNYLDHLRQPGADGKPYSGRYIGCLVGEIHRMLLRGGIYGNPNNNKSKKGNLRLLYECAPMSYLVEQAGGKATDGRQKILEITPTEVMEKASILDNVLTAITLVTLGNLRMLEICNLVLIVVDNFRKGFNGSLHFSLAGSPAHTNFYWKPRGSRQITEVLGLRKISNSVLVFMQLRLIILLHFFTQEFFHGIMLLHSIVTYKLSYSKSQEIPYPVKQYKPCNCREWSGMKYDIYSGQTALGPQSNQMIIENRDEMNHKLAFNLEECVSRDMLYQNQYSSCQLLLRIVSLFTSFLLSTGTIAS